MVFEHFFVAKDSSIDFESNSLSVFGIVEDIEIRGAGPGAQLLMQGIAVFRRQNERGSLNFQISFRVIAPDNREVVNQNLPVVMAAEHRRARIRFNFPLHIVGPGRYQIVLSQQGTEQDKERAIEIMVGLPGNVL